MEKELWRKLNNYLYKYVIAPFSVVILIAGLTACGNDSGKEHLSTVLQDESYQSSIYQTDDLSGIITDSKDASIPTESIHIDTTNKESITTEQETTTKTESETTSREATTEKPEPTTKLEPTTKVEPATKPEPTTKPEAETKPKEYNIQLELPEAEGTLVSDLNGYIIDYSNVDSGYVMIKATVDEEAVVQVRLNDKKGALAGQYVLKISNNYVAIPLTKGNVTYCVRIMQKNPSTGKYAEKNAVIVTPSIANERQPFKIPNVYVYYMKASTAVKLSYEICDGLSSDKDKVKAIYNYIVENIKYDYAFAKTAAPGYMDSERCLKNKSGICGDYSVLFATMCRAQGIPCIVVEGYVTADGDVYHAWNQVYYNNEWHFYDTTFDASGGKGSNYLENYRY